MKSMRILSSKKKGLTLIELIVTVMIVGIIAAPLSLMLVQHVEGIFQSSEQIATMNLARLEMERLKNVAYDSLPEGTSFMSQYHGYNFDVETIITKENYGAESLATINVHVLESGTRNIVARSGGYRARNIIYGM